MKKMRIGCLALLICGLASASHAEMTVVFEEDWDSGIIDPLVWELSPFAVSNNAYVVIDAVDGVSGDSALMYNGFGGWSETISSIATYNRNNSGSGLVVEFSTWVEGGLGAPAQGHHGPFHHPSPTNPNPGDANAAIGPFSIEMGVDWNWPFAGWSEDQNFNGGNNLNLLLSGSFAVDDMTYQSRFGHSLGKFDNPGVPRRDGAMRMRFTLGATQGGMIEWFEEDSQTWIVEGDFRDGNLGTAPQGESDTALVRLGWLSLGNGGGTGNGNPDLDDATGVARDGVFIDDIIVYFESASVGVPGDYNNDGTVNAADYVVFRNSEGMVVDFPNRDPALLGMVVGQGDYTYWKDRFGDMSGSGSASAVPEPSSMMLTLLVGVSMLAARRRS